MRKSFLTLFALIGLLFSGVGFANATTYNFEDMIDTWGVFNVDAAWIGQDYPLTYTHDINDSVNFAAGDYVTDAWLELDFTNDSTDDFGSKLFGIIKWDFREYATLGFDGTSWVNIGEVDNAAYSLILDIDWLNDDGLLDVTLSISNPLGTATAWLDHSKLSGTAATVPEPGTLILLGAGLAGLAIYRKKRSC